MKKTKKPRTLAVGWIDMTDEQFIKRHELGYRDICLRDLKSHCYKPIKVRIVEDK